MSGGLTDRLIRPISPVEKLEPKEKVLAVALYSPLYVSSDPDEILKKALAGGYHIEDLFMADVIHRNRLSDDLIREKRKIVIYLRKREEIVDDPEGMIVKGNDGSFYFYDEDNCDIPWMFYS